MLKRLWFHPNDVEEICNGGFGVGYINQIEDNYILFEVDFIRFYFTYISDYECYNIEGLR